MHQSREIKEFYELNRHQFDRFLSWKGMQNASDRSDVVQNYLLDVMQRGTLDKAPDSCSEYTNYMTRALQNHYIAWLRQERHWTGLPDDATNHNCFADSSVAPFQQLAIHEFQSWASDDRVNTACQELMDGKPARSSCYKTFQWFRNRYREVVKKK